MIATMVLMLTTSAHAALVTMSYDGFSHGSKSVRQFHHDSSRNARAGLFRFSVKDVSGVTAFDIQPGGKIEAFCVELGQNLKTSGNVSHELVDGLSYFKSQSLVDSISRLFTGFFANVTNASNSAAFQIALWELIEDGVPDGFTTVMSQGDYRVSSSTVESTTASRWLTQLNQFDKSFSVYILKNVGSQDLLIVNPLATTVPAPTTFGLMLSAALVALRFRRPTKR